MVINLLPLFTTALLESAVGRDIHKSYVAKLGWNSDYIADV